jgi:transposase
MDRASLEHLLGQGLSLAEIGRRVDRHEATVSYWVNKYGLKAVNHEKHASKGALERDKLKRLVAVGMSTAQIADSVGRSKTTVRHWLREYGLTTHWTARASLLDPRADDIQAAQQGRIPVRQVPCRRCVAS